MKNVIYQDLPIKIKSILLLSEGWLVGSAPEKVSNKETPNDYDIIVPNRDKFLTSIQVLSKDYPTSYTFNTYGGVKFQVDDLSVDIWCETLESAIRTHRHIPYAYNMKINKLLKIDL